MSRFVCSALALAVFALTLPACSGGDGGTPAPVNYSGDPVADFVTSIQGRDTEKVRELIRQDSSLMELRDELGQTPLHYAAMSNNAEIVEFLIEEGMDPNVRDNEGRTPLTVLEDSGFRYDDARDALIDNGGTN